MKRFLKFRLKALLVLTMLVALGATAVLAVYDPWRREQLVVEQLSGHVDYFGFQYKGPRWLQRRLQQAEWLNRVWEVTLLRSRSSADDVVVASLLAKLEHLEEIVIPQSKDNAKLAEKLYSLKLRNAAGHPVIITLK